MNRVLVTGIGMITVAGAGAGAVWEYLRAGTVAEAEREWGDLGTYATLPIRGWDPAGLLPHSLIRRTDRCAQLAAAAAVLAFRDAGLDPVPAGAGIAGSVGWGPLKSLLAAMEEAVTHERVNPMVFASATLNTPLGVAAIATGATGLSGILGAGSAVGLAMDAVRCGRTPVVCVVGVCEYVEYMHRLQAATGLAAASTAPGPSCRPFRRRPTGFVPGEAAVALILEAESHAVRRGRAAYCALGGYCARISPCHPGGGQAPPVADVAESVRDALMGALADAGTSPDRVAALLLNANGTILDHSETVALRDLFGARLARIPATTVKAVLGETPGAGEVMAVALAAMALHTETLPPARGAEEPDLAGVPECLVREPSDLPGGPVLVSTCDQGGIWSGVVAEPAA